MQHSFPLTARKLDGVPIFSTPPAIIRLPVGRIRFRPRRNDLTMREAHKYLKPRRCSSQATYNQCGACCVSDISRLSGCHPQTGREVCPDSRASASSPASDGRVVMMYDSLFLFYGGRGCMKGLHRIHGAHRILRSAKYLNSTCQYRPSVLTRVGLLRSVHALDPPDWTELDADYLFCEKSALRDCVVRCMEPGTHESLLFCIIINTGAKPSTQPSHGYIGRRRFHHSSRSS